MSRTLTAIVVLFLAACVPDTSRERVAVEVGARGSDDASRAIGDYQVTIVDARVAVGPLYFCSAAHASAELCATARLELLDPFLVDLLDPEPQDGGLALGTTGRVSSAQYDLGRSHLHAAAAPAPTSTVLAGQSAVFFLEVEGPERSFAVDLRLSLDPSRAGSTLVMGARTTFDVTYETESVTLEFDPWSLLGSIDFAALEASAAEGEVLTPGPGEQAFETVAARLTEGREPSFTWRNR